MVNALGQGELEMGAVLRVRVRFSRLPFSFAGSRWVQVALLGKRDVRKASCDASGLWPGFIPFGWQRRKAKRRGCDGSRRLWVDFVAQAFGQLFYVLQLIV
jgi:hypothetical protein